MAIPFGKGFNRAWLLSLTLLVSPLLSGQSLRSDIRGIYVYSSDVSQISKGFANVVTSSLGVLGVDGIVLVISWSSLEPSMGQYQWATLDQWMNQAITSGKKVDLTITAGIDTPSWLFQPIPAGAGACSVEFHHLASQRRDRSLRFGDGCPSLGSGISGALGFASGRGGRSSQGAGTYSEVTLLRITGINRTTDELRLPAETPQSTGLACVSDAVAIWRQAGYRPSLLLQGWGQITDSFKRSFPDKADELQIGDGKTWLRLLVRVR